MNSFKFALLTMALLLLSQVTFAQKRHHGKHRVPPIEQYKEALNLTSEQETQLEELRKSFKEEMTAIKEQDFEDRAAKKEAMHAAMEEHKAALENILTEEQQQILETKRNEDRKAMRAAHKEKRKATYKAMKAYKEQNVEPVMKAQRQKLEAQLSAEDKATIAQLRIAFQQKKEHMKALKQQDLDRKAMHEAFKQAKAEMKDEMEQLKALNAKYETEIEQLMEEIADQRKQWKEDMHNIVKAEGDHARKSRRGKGKGKRGKERGHKKGDKMMKKHHFLLMDPNAEAETETADTQLSVNDITIFPNPTSNQSTVSYTIDTAGDYTIELRDERGNVVKVLAQGPLEAGTYQVEADLSRQEGGVYYIALSNGKQLVSKKLILTRG